MQFTFPTESKIKKPNLFMIRHENREKDLVDFNPNIKQGVSTTLNWEIEAGVKEKDIVRLEW